MLLEGKNIGFKYPGSDIEIFKELNCRVDAPGFHALFGPSGVGKTTLAKIITGEITAYAGRISLDGMKHILYSYNLERLPGWSNVSDHLAATTPASNQNRIDELVTSFGLQLCLNSRFSQLSLGQKNRLNLVRYLLQDFDLLVMDESLANVDETTKEKIILKIKSLFSERCFLYISHNVVEVAKFCRRILVLRDRFKTPQIVSLRGQDFENGRSLDRTKLEHTMLEIVNAS
jgi:ABC-type multidrug transport system ATPase subunit